MEIVKGKAPATLKPAKAVYKKPFFNAKLSVGPADDLYEQEADAVADKIMRMPASNVEKPFFAAQPIVTKPIVQKKCPSCEAEEKLQRKEDEQGAENEPINNIAANSSEPKPEKSYRQDTLTHLIQRQEEAEPSTTPSPDPTGIFAANWFDMTRPFYNRGAEHLLQGASSYSAVLQPWLYNYNLFQSIGLGPVISTGASNFFTPLAIDSALKADYPTWWEITDREMGTSTIMVSPTLFNFDIHNIPGSLTMPAPLRNIFGLPENPYLQRKCKSCEEQEVDALQRKSKSSTTNEAPIEVHQALNAGGQSLDNDTKSFMESRFGYDFSHVRIHTDAIAAKSADSINALAYTSGNNIVFNNGQYAPDTVNGKRLLAHELTHVVQQTSNIQRFSNQQFIDAGCTPDRDQNALQADFDRAAGYLQAAVTAMRDPISDDTRRKIRWYFHREGDTEQDDILNNLQNTLAALQYADGAGDIRCHTAGGVCVRNTLAYVYAGGVAPGGHTMTPIHLCPRYFRVNAQERAETLIHEAAHLVGMSVSTDDVYDHTHRFRSLPASEALLNADSYALFARSITEGVPVGIILTAGGAGGALFGSASGDAGWFATVFMDVSLQHPRLYLVNPGLRLSMSLLGLPASGEEGAPAPVPTLIYSLLPTIRIEDPRPSGGTGYFAMRGGPTFNLAGSGIDFGAEVGAEVGYHWQWVQFSIGATYNFDPTAPAGSEHLVRLGPTLSFDLQRFD